MDTDDNKTRPIIKPVDLAKDVEQELLDSLLIKYEPEAKRRDDTRDMIRELERLTLELSLAIEEKKLNEYFDKQYRIYLVEQLSVSPLFADRIEKIIDLVKEDSIRIIADNEIVSGTVTDLSRLFMPEDSSEFIISIESREFLDSILETYDSDKAIINQFLHDFFRQIVSINDVIYGDIDELFLELSSSNRKTTIQSRAGKPISTMMLLLLITCQSSHYLSYLYPHNIITEVRDQIAMESELDTEDRFKDSRAAYYVMNSSEFNITNIIIDHIDVRPEVGCVIDSSYKIFDTQDCKKVYDIRAQTIFNEKSDRCLIRYNVTKV
jgi:hypothetical protein